MEDQRMNATEFESSLKRAGFQDVETKKVAPNTSTHPHSHSFSVRALVLAGDITLTSEGQSRTFRAGEVFEMAAGCVHSEQYGPDGSTYLFGRKS
jgi:quercetin dioxygenase-like cupin family protein